MIIFVKKSRQKNIIRGILGSMNRFLSIFFIVALGSGFMAGLAAASPDMYDTADQYMDDYNWYDIDIKSTQGLTKEDAAALSALDSIDTVQPARVLDMELTTQENTALVARVFAILDDTGETELNRFLLKEGRLPQAADECVVQCTSGRYFSGSLSVGDTLTLSAENRNYEDLRNNITSETLTVVGFVESPMCISVSAEETNVGAGRVDLEIYTHESFLTMDYYTDIYLSVSGAAELYTFGTAYENRIDDVLNELETLGKVRAPMRTQALRDEAQMQLDSLRTAIDTLEEIAAIRTSLGEDAAKRLPGNAVTASLLKNNDPKLAGLISNTGEAVMNALTNSEEESKDVNETLDNLRLSLQEGEDALNSLDDAVWILRSRSDAGGFSSYDSNVGKVAALSKIFPVFFFMVALLVALTTMTRLVEENRGQIGTLKALGFSNRQILSEYLFYSLLSSVLGCILGFSVGFRLFPYAISSAYSMMFTLPAIRTPFRLDIALWIAPVTVGSILLATLLACWSEFRAVPAELMQPKAPAAGKRIWLEHLPSLWKRIPFTHKVTCRNLFRYKKRFFMTVIGVAGCSALLLTGFGLRDSINDIVDKQFGEIYRYELSVLTDGSIAVNEDNALREILNDPDTISGWLPVASISGRVQKDEKSNALKIFVPAEDASKTLSDFITLRERRTGENIPFGTDSVVLTEKLCETLGIGVGDLITIENDNGRRGEVTVTGITENYLNSSVYLSPDIYRKTFEEEPSYTTLLCDLPNVSENDSAQTAADKITPSLLDCDHVHYVSSSLSLKENFNDSLRSIDGVILVLILSAGLLCMVVLYNLTNVNICERRKELATIRVLGFHKKEVERYIFRETNILSIIGSLCGLLVGIWLHSFVVRTVEIDQVMFGRSIYPLSFVFAFLISMLFTLLVNQIMRRQIHRIDMVEAMKAND